MDKKIIIEKTKTIANECAKRLGLEIIEVDFVYEFGIHILQIIAKSPEGLTLDEATSLNEAIGNVLDIEDFIDCEYHLEVSSEGIEKELRTNEDINEAIGQYIYIKTYEKINNMKEFYGFLKGYEDEVITINAYIKGLKKIIKIEKGKISLIRLAVQF